LVAGPAAYDPKVTAIQNKGGKIVHKETRFKDLSKEEVPLLSANHNF